jgi:hypothetical protein
LEIPAEVRVQAESGSLKRLTNDWPSTSNHSICFPFLPRATKMMLFGLLAHQQCGQQKLGIVFPLASISTQARLIFK